MLDTITSRDRPRAASQAANTNSTIGIMLDVIRCVFRIITVTMTNIDSIMPSRHRREDIRWDRYSSRPSREIVKANIVFV